MQIAETREFVRPMFILIRGRAFTRPRAFRYQPLGAARAASYVYFKRIKVSSLENRGYIMHSPSFVSAARRINVRSMLTHSSGPELTRANPRKIVSAANVFARAKGSSREVEGDARLFGRILSLAKHSSRGRSGVKRGFLIYKPCLRAVTSRRLRRVCSHDVSKQSFVTIGRWWSRSSRPFVRVRALAGLRIFVVCR